MEFDYHSFLLRLWVTEKEENQWHWMASLVQVSTNEKLIFSTIEGLTMYLQSITRDTNYKDRKGG